MNPLDTPSHSHLLRSKRTRNTVATDDSVKLPATKKRRSVLRKDTFEPLAEASINELAGQAQAQAHTETQTTRSQPRPNKDTNTIPNGAVAEAATHTHARSASSHARELTFRGGKKTEKRAVTPTTLSSLSSNAFYTVSHLPSLPDRIRLQPNVSYSCVISPENDYILALTHTDALLWAYNASSSTPSSRELVTFKLPFPAAIADDPLPIAAFTAAKAAKGEPGIVVVSPKWGKIVYWETLTLASSYASPQSSTAIHASIPGFTHGELVKDLVPAEPAGFVLSLASGRVAQLTVRDQLGRPGIGIQYMRKSANQSQRTGIFGSIRNVFGADRRKGTTIVRPGKSARAQRDVILCTEDADLEFWSNNLLTGNSLTTSFSIKAHICASLDPPANDGQKMPLHSFRIVDFALAETTASHHLIRTDDADSINLVFLVAIANQVQSTYHLVEAIISVDGPADGSAQVKVVHPLRDVAPDHVNETTFRPRICIPANSVTAFILFEKAVVIASLAKIIESPSSQLVAEKTALPTPFQDCIKLQDGNNYRLINFAAEEADAESSCVVAIQGYGLARLSSHLPNVGEVDVEDVVSYPDAKSRLEQVIFFSTNHLNPLDLKRSFRATYSDQELRVAIMGISHEIVSSKSKYVPKSSSSIAELLQLRARALQDLSEYCLLTYPESLRRADRFMLLRDAEKVACAQALWKAQEKIQSTYPKSSRVDDQNTTYFAFALATLSHKRQKYPQPEKGETDHVRFWLVHSVGFISRLLVEFEDANRELSSAAIDDPQIAADYYLEGTELWNTAFQAAFRFREHNAVVYGLGNETYENGVLLSGYPLSLPPAWTSNEEQVAHGQDYVVGVCTFLDEWWNYPAQHQNGSAIPKQKKQKQLPEKIDGEPYNAPTQRSLHILADRLPLQAGLLIRVMRESHLQQESTVLASDMSQQLKDEQLRSLEDNFRKVVNKTIEDIACFNRAGALQLAEAQKDTDLLVDLNILHLTELSRSLKAHPESQLDIRDQIRKVQDHVETYFDRFGDEWAYSYFSRMVQNGELGRIFDVGQANDGEKQHYLSHFFDTCQKRDKRLGKIAWLNEVIGEEKYDVACSSLETVATSDEVDIWSKKTELCLAKLAACAALENQTPLTNESKIDNINYELEYLQIIESLAFHINAPLYDAVDDDAAVQLAVEQFVPKSVVTSKRAQQTRKALSGTLYQLVRNRTIQLPQLVDALTLLELGVLQTDEINPDVDDLSDAEFPAALKAIDLAPAREATAQQKATLRKIVWRRLLIKDNWIEVNQTAGKSDKQVKEVMQRTVLFRSLLDIMRRADLERIEVQIPSIDDVLDIGTTEDKGSEETKAEAVQLKKFVDKARLKEHFGGLVQEAKDELRRFRDQEGEAQAKELVANGLNGDHS